MKIISVLLTIFSLSHADRRLLQYSNVHGIVTIPTDTPLQIFSLPVPTQQGGVVQIPPMTTKGTNILPNNGQPMIPITIPTGAALQPILEKKCSIPYSNPPILGTCAQTISNVLPAERFLLSCSDFGACAGSQITLNYPPGGIVQRIQGLWFTEMYSAKSAIITIVNQQPNQNIKIEQIQCIGAYACVDTTFVFKGGISVAEFKCTNEEYCRGCEVKNDISDFIGIPCNYY
eukprot:99504_1